MKKKWNISIDGRGMDEDEIIDAVLKARGIDDPDTFFYPTEDDLLPLDALKNIDKAYEVTMKAINNGWNFHIHGDVDCDGCTSAAIMYRYLKNFTDKISISINEGKVHGVDAEYEWEDMKNDTLVFIVDSVNSDYSTIYKHAEDRGVKVEVIILDHHIVPEDIDSRPILVSSANDYPNPQLSGAGVCLKFCQYVDFNELECYSDNLYDLAACGMVADMVDMTVMENRYIVKRGLENLANPGVKAVIGDYQFDSTAISFSIAPLVNAACRTYKNELALNLFTEDDVDIVYQTLELLRGCKSYQDDAVAKMMPDVMKQYETQKDNRVAIFLIEPRDDISIAGLLGNKLCDELQKSVLVLNKGETEYAGSARGVGVKSFIDYVREQKIEFSSGHENAFGLGIKKENLLHVKVGLEQALKDVELVSERDVDIQLNIEQINRSLIDKFKFYSKVTGECFKPLTVCIKGIKNATSKPMSKGKHMRMIKDDMNFIKWNSKMDMTGKTFDAFGVLDCSYWGRSWNYQLIINDICVEDE